MDKLIQALKQGICIVSYQKIDTGEIRDMECTLNPELIPGHRQIEQNADNDDILVYALDRNTWRSFRANTMTGWRAV